MLRRQCCLADVQAGRLVFLASSSVWAAKLRFHQSAIMAEARVTSGLKIEKFVVKVARLPPVPPEQTRRKPLSKSAGEHLKTAAQSLADPELRAVYLRLAALAEDSSSLQRK
jgi:Dna[CI] antecedent, DciA